MGNSSKSTLVILWGAGACLVVALGMAVLTLKSDDQQSRPKLAAAFPGQIAGWEGQDLPLGDAEVVNASTKLLNYDDYIYRVYQRGTEKVFLYAMYWKQGSISVREIAGHTPDGCWISNGAKFDALKTTRNFQIANRITAEAEERQFLFSDMQRVHVIWWHLWGDNIVDRGFDAKTLMPTLRELWVWLAKRHGVRRSQLLVRIHTSGNLDVAVKSEPVAAFLQMFPEVFTAKPLDNP